MQRMRGPVVAWSVAALLGALAFAVVWRSTPTGSFGATDSQTYLSVASNLAAGRGLTSSFTNEYDGVVPTEAAERDGRQALLLWPPLYPVALASGSPLGADPDHSARAVGALGAAITAVVAMRLLQRLTGSIVVSAVLVVTYLANIWSVLLFSTVSSEVLYVPLLLGATLALVRALERPTAGRLAAYTTLAAATALTRYTGLALPVAGAISLAIWLPQSPRRRLGTAAWTSALAVLPLVVWNALSRSGVTARNRAIGWYDKWNDVVAFVSLPVEWLAPPEDLDDGRGRVVGVVLLVASVAALVGWLVTRYRHPTDLTEHHAAERRAVLSAGPVLLVALGHGAFVVLSGYLLDSTLPMDQRMLMPAVPLLAGVVVGGIAWPLRDRVAPVGRWIAAGVLVTVLAWSTHLLWDVSARLIVYRDLPGLLDPRVPAETAAAFDRIPDDAVVFANAPTAVYAVDRRGSITVPHRSFPMSGLTNEEYRAELAALGELASREEIYVVWYVPTSALTDYLATEADLLDALPLELVADAPEVRVYRSVPSVSS